MTTPDPFPDTLEQLFGPAPAPVAAPVAPAAAADPLPPPAGAAPGPVPQS